MKIDDQGTRARAGRAHLAGQGQSYPTESRAMTQAHTPAAVPAARSISPSSSTNTRPIAMKMDDAACCIRLAKLPSEPNDG